MADPSILDYIRAQAARRNLDPQAVISVGMQEGLGHTGDHATGGGIGDSGTSFGPWQLHYGGAYPKFAPQGAQASHKWAWSREGINYALDQIAKVAAGQTGPAAVNSIVRKFERPALPDPEVARAISIYGTPQHSNVPFTDPAVASVTPTPKSTVGHALATNDVAAPLMREVPQPDQRRAFAQSLIGAIDAKGQLSTQGLLGALQKQKKLIWQSPQQAAPAPPAEAPTLNRTPAVAPQAPAPVGQHEYAHAAGSPIPSKYLSSIGVEHPTAGLEGYPAHDYMADAGSPVVAPVGGTIVRFSGHDPAGGPVNGVHGPFGWSEYLQGDDGHLYYLTHLGSRSVTVGDKVKAGQVIGTVGDYSRWGGASHVHEGIH
jgi:murein DD-endopeptidase MepM/ murein hydrolase activator NlpD